MHSINRRDFGIVVVATMLLPAGSARAEDVAVHIDNFVFEPAQLTVKVGQTVTWTNRDDIPHTVVCAGNFRSKSPNIASARTTNSAANTMMIQGCWKNAWACCPAAANAAPAMA